MSVRETVISQIREIAAENGKRIGELADNAALLDSGLDSLGIAILVARLEETLGFDPFTKSEDVFYPVTVGDFIRFYENAAGASTADSRQTG
jgi:acyl carrier protein